jgi:hypothetical protein
MVRKIESFEERSKLLDPFTGKGRQVAWDFECARLPAKQCAILQFGCVILEKYIPQGYVVEVPWR